MDEDEGQGVEDGSQGQVEETNPESGTGINPAWTELLDVIPSQLYSQVTPHLTKWDQNYQNGIQQVHSQYEPYKPFLDNGIAPDQLNYAMSVLQAIETNPKEVLTALQAYIGDEDPDEQGQYQPDDDSETPEWMNHPEWKKTQEMVNTMAQLLVQQRDEKTRSEADQQVATELETIREELGEFDEEWVLTKMLANDKLELRDAVVAYQEFEQGILSKARQPGPKVLSAGGSIPSQEINPKNLDPKARRNLVAERLAAIAQQNH